MYFKKVDEKSSISFVSDLLDYFGEIDNGSENRILTSNDSESSRNNVGWYRREDEKHKIFINIPNLMGLLPAIECGDIDIDTFYVILSLCTGHEFRHFMQGRCIWEGKEIDGYGQDDVFNSELMLYIRYFFDAYYILNKGYVKYEEDAEKFAVINTLKYLKENYPEIDAEKLVVKAVRYFSMIQSQTGIPTLPCNCKSTHQILTQLDKRMKNNLRIPDLKETLHVYNLAHYAIHEIYGLNPDEVLTGDLLERYRKTLDGSKQDLIVVKRILSLLNQPIKSLDEFPKLKQKVMNHNL